MNEMAVYGTDVPPEESIELRLPNDSTAPGRARQAVRQVLERWRLLTIVDACVLAASELVTNAFRHGAPPLSMSVRRGERCLRLDVRDGDPHPVDEVVLATPEHGESGRGLLLVQELADVFGSEQLPGDGKTVYAEWRTSEPKS